MIHPTCLQSRVRNTGTGDVHLLVVHLASPARGTVRPAEHGGPPNLDRTTEGNTANGRQTKGVRHVRVRSARPTRVLTGAVTGALLMATMGFGNGSASAATAELAPTAGTGSPNTGIGALKFSMRSGTLAAKTSPTLMARARMMLTRNRIVKIARAQLGDKYVAGHTGPNAFDCSGLTSYVYRTATGKTISRTSWTQYRASTKISRKSLLPGDLVFFFKRGVHHVGVYIGAGKMVHAARPRDGVEVAGIYDDWFAEHLSGFGRVLPAV